MQPQILNCMKNFLIGLFALIGTTGISAQTQSITVHSQTTGKEEVIDIPESMQSEWTASFGIGSQRITSVWARTVK